MAKDRPRKSAKLVEVATGSTSLERVPGGGPLATEPVTLPGGPLQVALRRLPPYLQSYRTVRHVRRGIVAAMLLLFAVLAGLWLYYQSTHVMSRNAMVRGHLSDIGTRLNGILESINVREGERAAAGQVLAHIGDRHIRSEMQEAKAELEGLERELGMERLAVAHERLLLQNKSGESMAKLSAAEAEVAAAESRSEEAQRHFEIRRDLLERKAVSKEEVRNAETRWKTAQALLNVAKANGAAARSAAEAARLASEGLAVRKQRVGILEANISRAKAKLEGASADVDGALIRAPEDGAVVRWLIQPGGSVEAGKPVVSMWVGKEIWVEAWIDEDDISRVQVGSEAAVTLQSFPGQEFKAVVDKVGLTTDFETPAPSIPQPRFVRTRGAPVVGVRVRLENPPATLLPGLSASVAIRDSSD